MEASPHFMSLNVPEMDWLSSIDLATCHLRAASPDDLVLARKPVSCLSDFDLPDSGSQPARASLGWAHLPAENSGSQHYTLKVQGQPGVPHWDIQAQSFREEAGPAGCEPSLKESLGGYLYLRDADGGLDWWFFHGWEVTHHAPGEGTCDLSVMASGEQAYIIKAGRQDVFPLNKGGQDLKAPCRCLSLAVLTPQGLRTWRLEGQSQIDCCPDLVAGSQGDHSLSGYFYTVEADGAKSWIYLDGRQNISAKSGESQEANLPCWADASCLLQEQPAKGRISLPGSEVFSLLSLGLLSLAALV